MSNVEPDVEPDVEEQQDEEVDAEAAAAIAAVAALAALIDDDVAKALEVEDEERRVAMLSALAGQAFTLAYQDAGGTGSSAEEARAYTFSLRPAFGLLEPDGSEAQQERMTDIIAHSATSAAMVAATMDNAGPDADIKFEWKTMGDDRVRDPHAAANGQLRAGGEPFDIGGHPQRFPGHAVGPPEMWINCRCYLSVHDNITSSAEPDTLIAREFDTKQRKKLADKGQAMPDGSFPIANEEDLRNAIQAIGRAKDPDAAKAHIRKRAKALGLTDLLPESWTASGQNRTENGTVLTAAPGTHDAPGWLTNPKETQRLRTYWTKGEGAAKIGWGSPGDLTRCSEFLGEYVEPQYVWGTCQNLHFEALGTWNESDQQGSASLDEINARITAAFAAAHLEETMPPPLALFEDPQLTGPTPQTIRAAGDYLEYVGHLAAWDTCHVGITGECVPPPRTAAGYAHFRLGEVETDAGFVATGKITMDTGHASTDLTASDTVAHYDNTGTVVADVAVGEDDYGIWAHGIVRPGISEDKLHALRAGVPSGDWRRLGGNLELVGALIVNVPGFPIHRAELAASVTGLEMSLVAAGVVTVDPNAHADRVAIAVLARLDQREADEKRRARAAALLADINGLRVEALTAAVR